MDEHDHGMQCEVRKLDLFCHKTIKLRMRARLIKPDHNIQLQKLCGRIIRRPQGAPTERQHRQKLLGKRMIGSCRRC